VASTQLILLLLQTVRLQISAAVRVSSLIKVPTSAWQLLPGVPTTSWGVFRRPLTQVPCLIWCLLPGIFDSAAARMTCCTPVSWVCQAPDALMLSPAWLLLPLILPSTPFYHTQHVLRHTKQYHLYHPPCANCPGVLMASWGVCIRCLRPGQYSCVYGCLYSCLCNLLYQYLPQPTKHLAPRCCRQPGCCCR
jgi:hypothetical protein